MANAEKGPGSQGSFGHASFGGFDDLPTRKADGLSQRLRRAEPSPARPLDREPPKPRRRSRNHLAPRADADELLISKARRGFIDNTKDVQRLLELHLTETKGKSGRNHDVEVLNKSCIVLTCAFWEAYCEDLAEEALRSILKNTTEVGKLPELLRKRIARELKSDKHELSVWNLAGDGWRHVLEGNLTKIQKDRNWNFNTPKRHAIDDLFENTIGLAKISKAWRLGRKPFDEVCTELDDFIELRGAIAHRGKDSRAIRKRQATDFLALVRRLSERSDEVVMKFVRLSTGWPMV